MLFLFCVSSLASESRPYTVYLKEGTLLKSLKNKNEVVLSKGIYAKVVELNPKLRTRFHVYNNDNIPTYEVAGSDVIEVEDDIRLLPNVDAEKIYPARNVFKVVDKIAMFESQLDLHLDNLQIAPFNAIYNDEIANVLSPRYEFRTLYVSQLPLKFGFALNYQSAYWINDFEDIKLSIVSLGPHFKYNFYKTDDLNASVTLGAEIAPIYEGSSALYKDKYSAQLFDLGIESEWLSPLGIFTLGSHFRHHQVALSETNRIDLSLTPKEFNVNSLGVMLGYKIEWNL